jgi:hypothetical protein
MQNTKIENISDIKLDFFLRQDKKDVRVVLGPGDISWCDLGSTTKSMILYARKNLIRVHDASEEVEKLIGIKSESFAPPINKDEIKTPTIEDVKENFKKAVEELSKVKNVPDNTIASELISVKPMSEPSGQILHIEYVSEKELTPLEIAEEETKKYTEKEPKKYTGKKRGRKKKRGPKPGAKKKKASMPTMSDETISLPQNTIITGNTQFPIAYSD